MVLVFPTGFSGFASPEVDIERRTLKGGTALSGEQDITSTRWRRPRVRRILGRAARRPSNEPRVARYRHAARGRRYQGRGSLLRRAPPTVGNERLVPIRTARPSTTTRCTRRRGVWRGRRVRAAARRCVENVTSCSRNRCSAASGRYRAPDKGVAVLSHRVICTPARRPPQHHFSPAASRNRDRRHKDRIAVPPVLDGGRWAAEHAYRKSPLCRGSGTVYRGALTRRGQHGRYCRPFRRAFRDFNATNVPATGAFEPRKADIRDLGRAYRAAVGAALGNVDTAKTTAAVLAGDLAWPAGSTALVYADANPTISTCGRKVARREPARGRHGGTARHHGFARHALPRCGRGSAQASDCGSLSPSRMLLARAVGPAPIVSGPTIRTRWGRISCKGRCSSAARSIPWSRARSFAPRTPAAGGGRERPSTGRRRNRLAGTRQRVRSLARRYLSSEPRRHVDFRTVRDLCFSSAASVRFTISPEPYFVWTLGGGTMSTSGDATDIRYGAEGIEFDMELYYQLAAPLTRPARSYSSRKRALPLCPPSGLTRPGRDQFPTEDSIALNNPGFAKQSSVGKPYGLGRRVIEADFKFPAESAHFGFQSTTVTLNWGSAEGSMFSINADTNGLWIYRRFGADGFIRLSTTPTKCSS